MVEIRPDSCPVLQYMLKYGPHNNVAIISDTIKLIVHVPKGTMPW